jgi:hypothetical protein
MKTHQLIALIRLRGGSRGPNCVQIMGLRGLTATTIQARNASLPLPYPVMRHCRSTLSRYRLRFLPRSASLARLSHGSRVFGGMCDCTDNHHHKTHTHLSRIHRLSKALLKIRTWTDTASRSPRTPSCLRPTSTAAIPSIPSSPGWPHSATEDHGVPP